MSNSPMARLLNNPVCFLGEAEHDGGVAISSRIRLARNLAEFPFPPAAAPEQLTAIRDLVADTVQRSRMLGAGAFRFDVADLPTLEQEILFERRLVSRDFLNNPAAGALLAKADESVSLMVNEEDHLRLQAFAPGFALEEVWQEIDKVDTKLESKFNFAFDDTLGYLTSCPTNAGTGMRASVMLHLPGLVMTGQIAPLVQGAAKLNLAVRGAYGEGTENQGDLYQISNQATLGESEAEIIEHLSCVIRQIISFELQARETVQKKDRNNLCDLVGRAYGLLRHAYTLSLAEALQALSCLRLGVTLNMFRSVDVARVNHLWVHTNPAHLNKLAGHPLSGAEADVERARLFRETLAGLQAKQGC